MSSSPPAGPRITQCIIPDSLWQMMLSHASGCLPEEACGLVAVDRSESDIGTIVDGTAGAEAGSPEETRGASSLLAAAVLPIENELHSPVRFRMAPAEQLKAFYWLEEQGMELGAIFHSHPTGPDHPSATDLAEFAYPGVLMLILSPRDRAALPRSPEDWQIRAYRIDNGLSSQLSTSEVPLIRLAGRNESPGEVL